MNEHTDETGKDTSPSIDWQELAEHSSAYADGATALSTRLALIEDRLRELPGMFECEFYIGGTMQFVRWHRVSGEWTFGIRRALIQWVPLSQMRVAEKAELAAGLPDLLLHMFREAKKRAELVAVGLNCLDEAEFLIIGKKEGE